MSILQCCGFFFHWLRAKHLSALKGALVNTPGVKLILQRVGCRGALRSIISDTKTSRLDAANGLGPLGSAPRMVRDHSVRPRGWSKTILLDPANGPRPPGSTPHMVRDNLARPHEWSRTTRVDPAGGPVPFGLSLGWLIVLVIVLVLNTALFNGSRYINARVVVRVVVGKTLNII